jgi:solute carrier family 25 carnitine/acylcarnitine transporter 20/29
MGDCFIKTIQGEGVRGLYKGLLATYASNVGKGTVGFGMYGSALSYFNDRAGVSQNCRDPWQSVLSASCVSGVASTLLECPLEITAIQLQTQKARAIEGQLAASGENFTCALHQVNAARRADYAIELRYGHEGLRDAFTSMLRNRSAFLGVSPLLFKNLVWFTATFGTYEQTKALGARTSFNDDSKIAQNKLSIGWKILCGASSGVVAWTACFPLEVIKANVMGQPLEKQYRSFESAVACTKQLYSEGGIPRFYRGLTPTLVRALPAYTIVLNTYDLMRQKLGCT